MENQNHEQVTAPEDSKRLLVVNDPRKEGIISLVDKPTLKDIGAMSEKEQREFREDLMRMVVFSMSSVCVLGEDNLGSLKQPVLAYQVSNIVVKSLESMPLADFNALCGSYVPKMRFRKSMLSKERGYNAPLGDHALEMLQNADNEGLRRFFTFLMALSEYMADVHEIPNEYNYYRVGKGISYLQEYMR